MSKTMNAHAASHGLGHWKCIDPNGNAHWRRDDGFVYSPKFNKEGGYITELKHIDEVNPMAKPKPGKTPWEFASTWYTEDEVAAAIARSWRVKDTPGALDKIPDDVYSPEFAGWMTHQYRLAMAKGIQIGREWLAD